MQNIELHIAYLLTVHDCVIVPKFGAFISSSFKQNTEELFTFPSRNLSFNPEINHNDGLLVSSISKLSGISYKEASILLEQYVDNLNDKLSKQRSIKINWVGTFLLTENGKKVFHPSLKLSANACNYGLNNFYISALEASNVDKGNEIKSKNEANDILYVPVNKKIVRWAGTAAAAFLALFIISTPVNQSSDFYSQEAALIPLPQKKLTTIVTDSTNNKEGIAASVTILPEKIETKSTGRMYYIVIASLASQELAELKAEEFRTSIFPSASVISKGDKHRVYINHFNKKGDAELFLKEFRSMYPKHASAWLLGQTN